MNPEQRLTKEQPRKEPKFELAEAKKNLERVFILNPELSKIGSERQYQEYLETIYPESLAKGEIVWHGNEAEFKDVGFEKGGKGRTEIQFSDDGAFYGFYFGDYYSHYGSDELHPKRMSYPVVLDIRKPRFIKPVIDKGPSSIDTTIDIKKQYQMTNEDSIVQLGGHWSSSSNLYTREEAIKYQTEINEQLDEYMARSGVSSENFDAEKDFPLILQYLKNHGLTSLGITELVVFEPSQIHILGSKSDIERFRNFVQDPDRDTSNQ